MTESEIASGLRDIWCFLSESQQKALVDNAIGLNCSKGDYIYHDEEESIYLYCMVRGHAKLEKAGVGGRSQIIRMFQPGDIFGYRSFFANQEHTTEAIAIENTQVACIPMTLIERFCLVNPDLAMYFLRNLAVDLGKSDLRTLDLTQKHIRGRLAGGLVFLMDKYGMEPDGRTLNISLSREDLASLSNMTTSNAIRTLASFSDEGIISVDGRRITVLDASKLKHVNAQG